MHNDRMRYFLLVAWLVVLALAILALAFFAIQSPEEAIDLYNNQPSATENSGSSFIELFFSILPYVILK